jgi:phospholipid/cholesterol/gamma-HCH transport system substrate-binding protein
VREITQDSDEAVIAVARAGGRRRRAVGRRGEILPTTLFGQKYISLSGPRRPTQQPIAEGDVVPSSDHGSRAQPVLDQLFPASRDPPRGPQRHLNALATALGGRGEEVGRTLDDLDDSSPR